MTFRIDYATLKNIEKVKSSDEESTRYLYFTENIPGILMDTILLRGMKRETWNMASEQRTEP